MVFYYGEVCSHSVHFVEFLSEMVIEFCQMLFLHLGLHLVCGPRGFVYIEACLQPWNNLPLVVVNDSFSVFLGSV